MVEKIDNFNSVLVNGAAAAKLLGHPARMEILDYLASKDFCQTGDISSRLPLSRGTVNQHLKALKDAGWVKGTIVGAKICYCVDFEKLSLDTKYLVEFINNFKNKKSSC